MMQAYSKGMGFMHKNRHIMACIIGNILEWYEFSLFAFLSPVIANLFFPSSNPTTALLSTLLVFAAGFVVRPLGSILLGHLGDNLGRAKTLKLTIFLISISSILTGLIPTYSQAGILAPILLILCRLIQGFCIGGEFAGSIIYLAESAQSQHRGLISCMTNNGSNIGVLIAVIACTTLSGILTHDQLISFGWRSLFISGGILGLIGLWLRKDFAESATFIDIKKNINETYFPLMHVFKYEKKRILQIILILCISACGSYTLMGFISIYLHEFLNIPLHQAYQLQVLFIIFSLLITPIFAVISDKIGRKRVLYFSTIGYLICAVPIFSFLQHTQTWWILLPLIVFYSAEQAVMPVIIVELFPSKGRYTGISIAYNICMALVGGFSPAINTWLIHYFNNNLMISYYISLCALISFIIAYKYLPKEYGAQHDLVTAQL